MARGVAGSVGGGGRHARCGRRWTEQDTSNKWTEGTDHASGYGGLSSLEHDGQTTSYKTQDPTGCRPVGSCCKSPLDIQPSDPQKRKIMPEMTAQIAGLGLIGAACLAPVMFLAILI